MITFGQLSSETTDHLLIHCDYFGMVWHRIYQWLGISFTAPASASDHLYHVGHLAGLPAIVSLFYDGNLDGYYVGLFGRKETTGFLTRRLTLWIIQ